MNRETGDTVLWNVSWESDCRYLLTYVSGNRILDATSREASRKHVVNVQITAVAPAYYLYQTGARENKDAVPASDTLWRMDHPEKRVHKNVVQASFPGGLPAWQKYLAGVFAEHRKEIDKMRTEGVCYVRFVVSTDGKANDVEPLTMKETAFAKIAVDAFKNGPGWLPGSVDGVVKETLKIQPIAFRLNW